MPRSAAVRIDIGFKGKNLDAQRVARKQAAKLVTRVTLETRTAIRAVIVRSIAEGIPPTEAARLIVSMIGMTARDAGAAINYRRQLVNSGISVPRVDLMVERYVAKKIRERALSIARTETMEALNSGQEVAWRRAQREGTLGPRARKRVMVTASAKNPPCPAICSPMDGKTVPLRADFTLPDGRKKSAPPFHPRCRCELTVVP